MPESKIKKLAEENRRLKRLVGKLESELEEAALFTDHDVLTGLYNRRGFIEEAEKFLKEIQFGNNHSKRRHRFNVKNFSIVFVDLDDLKKVNDLYGHKAGDDLIKSSANVFKKYLREMDIVARWGGDEFVIGLVNLNDKEAYEVAEKLKKKMATIKIPEVKNMKFSASFGVVSAKDKNHHPIFNLHELIEKADAIMYKAKKEKKKGFIERYIEKIIRGKTKVD